MDDAPIAADTPPAGALTLIPDAAPEDATDGLVLNDPVALAAQLASYGEARRLLVEWLWSQLVAGIDFTLIHRKVGPRNAKSDCPAKGDLKSPACPTCGGKSTLCKPGAEKICGLLRLRPRFRRDVEAWEMLGSEPGLVCLVCELVTVDGTVVAEGRGARHRDQDYGDANKTLKMTQKSGQTDAVLRLVGLSEFFSQDLEDSPRFAGGGTDAADGGPAEFETPRSKSGAPVATPPPATLQGQLEESVRRTAPAAAPAPAPRPAPAPAARPASRPAPATANTRADPPTDALSPGRVNRLMALLHEAVEGAGVPTDEHAGIFDAARGYLVRWVAETQGRERLSDCSWRAYDELCAQVPTAVEDALGGGGPRPRPRLVRRYARPAVSSPRQFAAPRRNF